MKNMNRKILGTILILGLVLGTTLLGGCQSTAAPASSDKLQIIVSIFPLEDFTNRVGGEYVEVKNLMPGGADAHDFEPSTQDMVAIQKADHVFVLGQGFEHWAEDVFPGLQSEQPGLLVVGANLETATHPVTQQIDPHLWTSLRNDILMMDVIRAYLSEVDPDHAADYQKNYDTAKADYEAMDQRYTEALKNRVRNEFVPNHAAFGYLASDYGLSMVPIMGIEPDAEPDAASMAQIIDVVKQYGIPYILYEDEADTAVAEAIAAETGAKTGLLRPNESITEANRSAGKDYLDLMAENLVWLEKALTE